MGRAAVKTSKRAKGRAARRQPLPTPHQTWAFPDGPMEAEFAEVLLRRIEANAVLKLSAETTLEQMLPPQPGETARQAWEREYRKKRVRESSWAPPARRLMKARVERAALLELLRELIGHAERNMARDTAAANARRRAGIVYRKAFAEALATVKAAKLPVTVANLRAKWPVHSSTPVDSTIRELLAEHDTDI